MSNPIIFDGIATAQDKERELLSLSQDLQSRGFQAKIAAILFREDKGSVLYTGLKRETAARLGIQYEVFDFSLADDPTAAVAQINLLNADDSVTGIIVQKPWQQTWVRSQRVTMDITDTHALAHGFAQWWRQLVTAVAPTKDVDGLTPSTLEMIKTGNWQAAGRVLPATCQAVLSIIDAYSNLFLLSNSAEQGSQKVAIIGRSDLLGTPLFWVLKHRGCDVFLLGKKELKQGIEEKNFLHGFGTIISATGIEKLLKAELIDEGVCVVDVGEPKGDVDFITVSQKAKFITPVPGGVGPMTVISLMANCLQLLQQQSQEKW